MYEYLLVAHNLFRWILVVWALYALYINYSGWKNSSPYTSKNKAINATFVGLLDLQLIMGLILYFVYSKVTQMAFANMAAAMRNKELRFWAVEHITGMVLVVVLAHIGSIVSKRAKVDSEKFRKAFIYFTIAVLLIILSHPLAFHGGNRPWNPFENLL